MERAELKALALATGVAQARGEFVFLCDPGWGEAENRAAAEQMAQADALGAEAAEAGWLCIPTGGTSGRIRFARHDEQTISAAVSGFCLHFGVARVNAVSVLPLCHVSGFMAQARCAVTGGEFLIWDWKRLAAGDCPPMENRSGDWFLSLVPTQLQRMLELPRGPEFLRRFRVVFLGGGPTWPALADAAAQAGAPVVLSYGMSETSAMIAAQTPEQFAAGRRDCGRPMPHARVEVVDEDSGRACEAGTLGRVYVSGESVFRGYFPEWRGERAFATEDLGLLDERGALQIVGRRDAAIITGGKKVWPDEVEAALRATGLFSDVAVVGVEDPKWGQAVVACCPVADACVSLESALGKLEGKLANYKMPKRLLAIERWPRNAQGKLNRAALAAEAKRGA